jgi:molybdenum cofactor cytidylyltransferase
MIFGLIPAAGKSERMGRPKLALPLGERTVLEHVVSALRAGGADEVLVVIAPHVALLERFALSAGAQVLLLSRETPDMRATVEAGLDWLEAQRAPGPEDSWLLAPADHPTMDAQVVRRLIDVTDQSPADTIVVPTWQGTRGHPVLIRWTHVAAIRRSPKNAGLNEYLRSCAGSTREIEVPSNSILADMDTPEDYERLPSPAERQTRNKE